MEETIRKPYQGIKNIIRFNWQYYLTAVILIFLSLIAVKYLAANLAILFTIIIALAAAGLVLSIAASYYIYDYSNLYKLDWLDHLGIKNGSALVSINAGFDETSILIKNKYNDSKLTVLDFYDSKKHTEVSIERARRNGEVYPGTIGIKTSKVPLEEKSADCIFLFLAVHEIRDKNEQILFFKQLKKSLNEDGIILVIEHTRDIPNFIAYNLGFMHFFSKKHWRGIFKDAGLSIMAENKITPFITNFILKKNGSTS